MPSKTYLDAKRIICKKGVKCGSVCIPKSNECQTGKTKTPSPDFAVGLAVGGIAATGIILGGTAIAATEQFKQIRKTYQDNFASSAVKAQKLAESINAPTLGEDIDSAVFVVGGFGTADAFSSSQVLKNNIDSLGLKRAYVEPVSYEDFNVPTLVSPDDDQSKNRFRDESLSLFVDVAIAKKYNPAAVQLAAKVIAYQKQNPSKEFHAIGHSGGGLIVQEANEILLKAGVKIKATAFGSPDIGFIPGNGDVVTAGTNKDEILRIFGGRMLKGRSFNQVQGHKQSDYFNDPDFREFLSKRLRSDMSSTYSKSREDAIKAICKKGKSCGDVCIPKTSKCASDRPKQKKQADIDPAIALSALTVVGLTAASGLTAAGLALSSGGGGGGGALRTPIPSPIVENESGLAVLGNKNEEEQSGNKRTGAERRLKKALDRAREKASERVLEMDARLEKEVSLAKEKARNGIEQSMENSVALKMKLPGYDLEQYVQGSGSDQVAGYKAKIREIAEDEVYKFNEGVKSPGIREVNEDLSYATFGKRRGLDIGDGGLDPEKYKDYPELFVHTKGFGAFLGTGEYKSMGYEAARDKYFETIGFDDDSLKKKATKITSEHVKKIESTVETILRKSGSLDAFYSTQKDSPYYEQGEKERKNIEDKIKNKFKNDYSLGVDELANRIVDQVKREALVIESPKADPTDPINANTYRYIFETHLPKSERKKIYYDKEERQARYIHELNEQIREQFGVSDQDTYVVEPPKINNKSWNEILSVSPNASQAEVKKAYKNLARKYHPDVNPGNLGTVELFKEINNAYDAWQRMSDSRMDAMYENSRQDAIKKAVCKTGKPCGDVCIPKTSECKTNAGQQSQSLRNPAIATSPLIGVTLASAGAFLGIAIADKKYRITDDIILGAAYEAHKRGNTVDWDKQINSLPISDGLKSQATELVGASKAFVAKQILAKNGAELLSVDPKNNLSTFKQKDGSLMSVGSSGTSLFSFGSSKANVVNGFPLYEMGFKVNENYSREEGGVKDKKKGIALIRMAQKSFDEHIKYLPDTAILRCRAHKGDDAGGKRQNIYEKKGFQTLNVRGDYLWASKNLGQFQKIPDNQKEALAKMIRGDRNDSVYDSAKKAVCKVGKSCGDVCIPKASECSNNAPNTNTSINAVNGVAAGAALMGVSSASYLAVRNNYRAGFEKSAQMAEEMAKSVEVEDIPDNQTKITFATGGFYGPMGAEGKKKAEDYFSYKLKTNILDEDHHVVTHRNDEFNSEANPALIKINELAKQGKKPDPLLFAQMVTQVVNDHYKTTLEPIFKTGRNPEAVKLAAKVVAYKEKYPDKEVTLTGHSAGGMINHETAEILNKRGIKVKVVNFGSGYFGMTEKVGESATIVNRGDFYFKSMAGVRDPVYVGEDKITDEDKHSVRPYMNSPEVIAAAKKLFNKAKKSDSAKTVRVSASFNSQQLKQQFSVLLSRVYGQPIRRVGNLKVSADATITGMAQDSARRILSFTFKGDRLTYKIENSKSMRIDSTELWNQIREDRKKQKECKKGIPCGDACIPRTSRCQVNLAQVASPSETIKLKQAIANFVLEENANNSPTPSTPPENDYSVNPDTQKPYTIRELRKVASEKGVVGYGSMPLSDLKAAIKLSDTNPESRDRVIQGVARRKTSSAKAIAASGLSGRGSEGKAKRAIKNNVDTWRKLEALAKFAGSSSPEWGVAAGAAFLFGATVRSYERAKQSYREGFEESARAAEERASKFNIQHPVESNGEPVMRNGKPMMSSRIIQDNITFAVGSGKGYGAEEIKRELQKGGNPESEGDQWFAKSNYVIPVNLKEFGTPNIPGQEGVGAIANEVVNGVGGILQNFRRKRNQDAVDLAANIYAHAIAVSQSDGTTLVNKDKKINILAHGPGGMVAKEALEILSRMELKGSPSGKKVLEQVNAVYLGTPHFGFAENVSRKQKTIISQEDPLSVIPAFGEGARQQWISSVKGHSPKDYLSDPAVRDSIRESFGYYQGSPSEVRRKQRKAKVRSRSNPAPRSDAYGVDFELAKLNFCKLLTKT